MASTKQGSVEKMTKMPAAAKKEVMINKGAWTAEEDKKLAEVIAVHGAKRWKMIASKAGLNRCGKSCRLRWLNYLRPNIKRGNISDQEEDLIVRLHKLLGNRWSLIAGRLPGRTDNEIKNYWNSHLSKKIKQRERQTGASDGEVPKAGKGTMENKVSFVEVAREETTNTTSNSGGGGGGGGGEGDHHEDSSIAFNVDDFFDFSNEDPLNLEWMSQFLELDKGLTAAGMS